MNAALIVFLGGGLGSLLRYGIAKGSLHFFSSNFPIGTFIANILACVVLAIVVYSFYLKVDSKGLSLFLITGFCGGLSTFSTFSYETLLLIKNQMWGVALLNIGLSLVVGILAIYFLVGKMGVE